MSNPANEKPVFEAIIQFHDGLLDDAIDPVHSITINNGVHDYTFGPDLMDRILIRKRT